ncbi:hypothetical protein AB4Z50_34650 [Paenibacillus sp. 2TAB26]
MKIHRCLVLYYNVLSGVWTPRNKEAGLVVQKRYGCSHSRMETA